MDAPPAKTLSRKTSVLKKSFKLRSQSLNSLRLRRVFDTFDKNGDNLITVEEINDALMVLGLESNTCELNEIVTTFIKPEHNGLTFDDFVALHESLSETFYECADDGEQEEEEEEEEGDEVDDEVEYDLSEAFKVFDEDGDGFISAKELKVVLGKLGLPEGEQELDNIQQMISCVDQNSDGQVDFFEFKHMMLRSVLVPSS